MFGEKATYLDNPINAHINLRQDRHNIIAALLRLICDAAFDQVALFVRRDLARDVDLRACDYGLGLGDALALLDMVWLPCG
jgi:hypothetical protein